MNMSTQAAKTKSGNIQQTIILNMNDHQLSKTIIYDLLKKIESADISLNTSYSLELPSPVSKKLIYNNAMSYKMIFNDYSSMLNDFSQVIEGFENSEAIVLKVNHIFLKNADYTSKGTIKVSLDGDKQLDKVKEELASIIKSDYRCQENYYDEQIEAFIYTLMLYCVEKCKILINPNEMSNQNDFTG